MIFSHLFSFHSKFFIFQVKSQEKIFFLHKFICKLKKSSVSFFTPSHTASTHEYDHERHARFFALLLRARKIFFHSTTMIRKFLLYVSLFSIFHLNKKYFSFSLRVIWLCEYVSRDDFDQALSLYLTPRVLTTYFLQRNIKNRMKFFSQNFYKLCKIINQILMTMTVNEIFL